MSRYRVVRDELQPDKFGVAIVDYDYMKGEFTVRRVIPAITANESALRDLISMCNAVGISSYMMDSIIVDFKFHLKCLEKTGR
ncbi:MAG: hypothetical protein IJ333_10780 [Clostridia bacterium]|nr:hypothetical protein [Clostridia bacterium]